MTAPSDEALQADIRLSKEMGFNGARKHQKIEDPRYYYWADTLGFLVWGELPSAYEFNDNAIINSSRELIEFVERDFNHPSLVTWVPLNESWGVKQIVANKQQQDYARALYYLLKALDSSRMVSTNDGWEQVSETDMAAIHDYALFANNLNKYDDLQKAITGDVQGRILYADGNTYTGGPILITEYGGIAFAGQKEGEWGYFGAVKNEEEFLARLDAVTTFFIRSGKFQGYCYTQLTDVQQEVNGLLYPDRKPKIDPKKLKAVFGKSLY